jgi:hypothetical protein
MPKVDDDVIVYNPHPENRPIDLDDVHTYADMSGLTPKDNLETLTPKVAALPFNATAREEYDSKVDKALQVATTKVVLDAYLHLPTLSKIRSVREVILHFLPVLNNITKVRYPQESNALSERICVELSAFHDWAMLEQYQVPDTLSRYVRDAQRLFTNASAISQAEKLADIIKRFLPRFDEMSQQYLPPEGKTLPEDSLLKLNAYLTWVKEEEITKASLDEQQTLLINALYLCCRSRFALFGVIPFGEEIYNSVYYLPAPNDLSLIPIFKASIAAAILNTNRQDCLLDLVSAAFPNFMTFSLNPVPKDVPDDYPLHFASSSSSDLNPHPKEVSPPPAPPPPQEVSPPPPPPPPPISLISGSKISSAPLFSAVGSSGGSIAFQLPSVLPILRHVESGDDAMSAEVCAVENEPIHSLKQAASQATSIQSAVARLKCFLEAQTHEQQAARLDKLAACADNRSYQPGVSVDIIKNQLAEIKANKRERKIDPLTEEQLEKKRQHEAEMRVKDAELAAEKAKKEGVQLEYKAPFDPDALARQAEFDQQTNEVLNAFKANLRCQHESDSESDQNDAWSDSDEEKIDEEFARLTLRN